MLMSAQETTKDLSFKDCLKLLYKAKALTVPLLQIVYVDNRNLKIQDWFYTDHSLTVRKKERSSYKDVIFSFATSALPSDENKADASLLPSERKICYLVKVDKTKQPLLQHQMAQLLLSTVTLVSVKIIAFQQYVKYKFMLRCTVVYNSLGEYDATLDRSVPLLEHRVKSASFRIVGLINERLKGKKVMKTSIIYTMDKSYRIHLSDITECFLDSKTDSLDKSSVNDYTDSNAIKYTAYATRTNTRQHLREEKKLRRWEYGKRVQSARGAVGYRPKTYERPLRKVEDFHSFDELVVRSNPAFVDSRMRLRTARPSTRESYTKSIADSNPVKSANQIIIKIPKTDATETRAKETPVHVSSFFLEEAKEISHDYGFSMCSHKIPPTKSKQIACPIARISLSVGHQVTRAETSQSRSLVQILKVQQMIGAMRKKKLLEKSRAQNLRSVNLPAKVMKPRLGEVKGNSISGMDQFLVHSRQLGYKRKSSKKGLRSMHSHSVIVHEF